MRHKALIAKLTASKIPDVPDDCVALEWARYVSEFSNLVLTNQDVWCYVEPSQISFCTTNKTWDITVPARLEERVNFTSGQDSTFVKLQKTVHVPFGATIENVIEVMNALRKEICLKATAIAQTLYKL